MAYSEVESVSGYVGNFDVRVQRKPRYIDESVCTGCAQCADVCPISIPSPFDLGLSTQKAAYRQSAQAVPGSFTIEKLGVAPCREACPVKSFKKTVYSADALGQSALPSINGTYDRVTCNRKMDKDIEKAVMAIPAGDEGHTEVMQAIDEFEEGVKVKLQGDKLPHYCVKYCRKCELACPVGK